MIDIGWIRERPAELKEALARRNMDQAIVDVLVRLDEERRATRILAEDKRAEQKSLGREIAKLEGDDRASALQRASDLSEEVSSLTTEADALDDEFLALFAPLPNPPHESVPMGDGEEDNVEIGRFGDPASIAFEPKDHLELGAGIIDTERGAKVSGARFAYLLGDAVFLEFALVRFALDRLSAAGFTPVVPPVLVREEALYGTGFFPDDDNQVYQIPEDDLYLVGTSEVPLAAYHADEIFAEADLPLRYAGFSTCFRREAGAAGRDTRGILRVHQFDKVEMFSFCHPDKSWEEHEFLFSQEESLIQELGIPYRVVNVCTGDLGASAAKKYDVEAWMPAQQKFREITSCSNTTDYQARRLKVRFKGEKGNQLVHTLNGTAVAIGRMLIAIMENNQRADGTVVVPEALVPYTGFEVFAG